jgi:hypothetical protein
MVLAGNDHIDGRLMPFIPPPVHFDDRSLRNVHPLK